jgi:hypothetical protein
VRLRASLLRRVIVAALLAGASAAHAQDGAPASAPAAGEERRFGLVVDAGFPDGVGLGAMARPWRFVRVDAGVTYNVLAFGLRGGVTFVAPTGAVAPLLRLEIGHTFAADATGVASWFATLDARERLLLASVSYDYGSAQIGLELRTSQRTAFFVRAGLAYATAPVNGFEGALQTFNPANTGAGSVHATAPTASLGYAVELF